MEGETLYPVELFLPQRHGIALWYSGEQDGLLLQADGKLQIFPNCTDALAFARERGYTPAESITVYAYPPLQALQQGQIDCPSLLDWWNLFSDIAQSVHQSFSGDAPDERTQNIYNKLFYGCNFPAMRQDGPVYHPVWSDEERAHLQKIMEDGLALATAYWPDSFSRERQ